MTQLVPWPVQVQPAGGLLHGARRLLALGLHILAAIAAAAAHRVTPKAQRVRDVATLPRLEFHAEAGAPEGALYVDGALFGHIQGVQRL